MVSNAPSAVSGRTRASSLSKQQKAELLKSDILSKEEEARVAREKREKMEEMRGKNETAKRARAKVQARHKR